MCTCALTRSMAGMSKRVCARTPALHNRGISVTLPVKPIYIIINCFHMILDTVSSLDVHIVLLLL